MKIYKLTNETIDILSEEIGRIYAENGISRKDTLRAKLLLEEALLKYKGAFGEETELYFRTYRIFSQTRLCLRIRTPSFDPFVIEDNPMAFMLQSILSSFNGMAPTWRFKNYENEIVFTIKRRTDFTDLQKILLSLIVSALLGVLCRIALSEKSLSILVDDYLGPFTDAYAGLFCVMAVLVTLFDIILGIVSVGDIHMAGSIGAKIMRRFLIISAAATAVFVIPLIPFLSIRSKGDISIAFKSLYDIMIDFIPVNLVSPFAEFNSIHVIIIGAMFGFSLLSMGQKGEHLVTVFDECSMVAFTTNRFINRFIYIYVGLKIFEMITVSSFRNILGAGMLVVWILTAELCLFVFFMIRASRKIKMPVRQFVKKQINVFIICLSSANLGAAASTMIDSLNEMGVNKELIGLSLSLGSIIFQPSCTVVFAVSSLFMGEVYNVEISIVWLAIAVLLSLVLAATVPNIPGASISIFTLLYSQLGLPSEALALMIAIYALLQFTTVAVDAWCLQCETIYLYAEIEQRGGMSALN